MNIGIYRVKSEMELNRKYPDIIMMPKEEENYYTIMIEFKYLKKAEEAKIEEKQKEASKQIREYAELEEIKAIGKLNKYTVIAVNDKIYVEKI